ncbi:MAG: MarR family transcriptional regulator [Ruminococcus sp.]|nr:MarR family transcriptional regulator [Ruminococcus sp.]
MSKTDEYISRITAVVNRTDSLYEKWAKRAGVNSYTSKVLYMLRFMGISSQKNMAENYGMPKQTVNTVTAELLKKELVILETDAGDKRSKRVILTPKGEKYADRVLLPLLECERKAVEKMGSESAEIMISAMDTYAALLERELEELPCDNGNTVSEGSQ